jgi:hypothetical protein
MPDDIIDYLNQLERPSPTPMATPQPVNPFADLPPLMKTIIDKELSAEINADIEQKHRLTEPQGDAMMDVIRKVIFRTITPNELLTTVQRDIKLDTRQATELTIDLLGRRFLPMEWYIGDVQGIIRRLGGHAEDYLLEAKRNYPEVYAKAPSTEAENAHPVLDDFEQRISTMTGKAEILLRLTGLSSVVEEAMNRNRLPRNIGEGVMRQLEAVSYAINTHDLNPFEVQSIKRKLKKIIGQVETIAQ